jgi:hypothetical protein
VSKLVFYDVALGFPLWPAAFLFVLACLLVLILELYHLTRGKKLR